jgi:hypothetical protein
LDNLNSLAGQTVEHNTAGDFKLMKFRQEIIEANPAFKTINIYPVVKATQKDQE